MGHNGDERTQHVDGASPDVVKFPWPVAIAFAVVLLACLVALFTGFAQ